MKTYELTFIISPELTTEEAEAHAKAVGELVQGKEGIILKQDLPVAKTLSYPIKKQASGYFGIMEFQIEPEKLAELDETIKKDGKIVRHMVIIKKPLKVHKQRRTRKEEAPVLEKAEPAFTKSLDEPKEEVKEEIKEEVKPSKKVELKDIEEKLDEILGE